MNKFKKKIKITNPDEIAKNMNTKNCGPQWDLNFQTSAH